MPKSHHSLKSKNILKIFKGKSILNVWQKCMSFSKCSNLEAKTLYTSNFAIKVIIKRSNYNLRQTKSRKQSFLNGFYATENYN